MYVLGKGEMPLHQKAFWGISFFLGGVLLMSLLRSMLLSNNRELLFSVLIGGLITLAFFIFNKHTLAWLSLALIIGALYYGWFDASYQRGFSAPMGKQIELTGLVTKVATRDQSQSADLELGQIPPPAGTPFYKGRIRIFAQKYPEVKYGDVLKITGSLKPIEGKAEGYYQKEGISAVMSFPKNIEIIDHNQGSAIKAALYDFRDQMQASFERALSPSQATLLTGIVLGKSGGFDKEFTQKLKDTGTTHLVALSGQNISIIMINLVGFLGFFLSRRTSLTIAMVIMAAFVLMTGAEASVVRAALMATIVVIAERSGRLHLMKNALAVTAGAMILFNPKILVFDVGFQLSFLAVIGIVYLKPALQQFFKAREDKGFLEWRDNFWTTISAQLAVLPILLLNFGFFPPLSIITNILILSFIPMTMFWGFLIFFVSAVSAFLSIIVALPARLLLGYELMVIDFFSRVSFGMQIESFSLLLIIGYYALMIWFMLYLNKKQKHAVLAV